MPCPRICRFKRILIEWHFKSEFCSTCRHPWCVPPEWLEIRRKPAYNPRSGPETARILAIRGISRDPTHGR